MMKRDDVAWLSAAAVIGGVAIEALSAA